MDIADTADTADIMDIIDIADIADIIIGIGKHIRYYRVSPLTI